MIVLSPFVTSFCHKVVWPFQNSHQSNLIQTSELLFPRNPITLSLGMERLLELMTELPPPQKEGRKDSPPPEVSGSAVWFQGLRFNTKVIYCIYWMTHQDKNVGKEALWWHSTAVLLSPHGAVVCSWERGQVALTGLKWGPTSSVFSVCSPRQGMWLFKTEVYSSLVSLFSRICRNISVWNKPPGLKFLI